MEAVLIKYKVDFPKETKMTSYLYQSVFRELYGYIQNVTKPNGQVYRYFKKGVLSGVPYYKPSKNAVIVASIHADKIIDYLSTGISTINHKNKLDWTCRYTIEDIKFDLKNLIAKTEKIPL